MKDRIIKYANIILLLIVISIGFFYYFSNRNISLKYKISSQNEKALSDSLRIIKDKYDLIIYEKNILVANESELKDLSKNLYIELNTFKKDDKKKLITISLLNGKINFLNDSIGKLLSKKDSGYIRDDKIETLFDFSDEYKTLKGGTSIFLNYKDSSFTYNSFLTNFSIDLKMTTGLKKNDEGNYEIYFKTNNPYFTISNIEGSIIDKSAFTITQKEKKFGVGFQIGYGIGKNLLTPYFGIGLSYNFWKF